MTTEPKKFKFKTVERPVLTSSTLDVDFLRAIQATEKTNNCVEVSYEGDKIGERRLIQNLTGLANRKKLSAKVCTLRRGGKLYIWLEGKARGRPRTRVTEPLPPEPDPSGVTDDNATQPSEAPTHD